MGTTIRPIIADAARLRYQRHSLSFKRKLVALTLLPGTSVARLAREHGVNANQLFSWRKLYREGRLGTDDPNAVRLLPVEVAPSAMAAGSKPRDDDPQRNRVAAACASNAPART